MKLLKSQTGRILLESHRGAEALAPENSWEALKLGCEAGADFLEVDVQISLDDVAFLQHNYGLPDGRMASTVSWDEISQTRVPRLEEVLVWAKEVQVYLSLDLKVGFSPERKLARAVLRLLDRTGTAGNVILLGWDHVELRQIKESHPTVKTRALLRGRLVDYAGFVKVSRVDAVSLSYDIIRPADVEQVHATGTAILLADLWKPDFEFARQMNVDMVSWGDPRLARKMLEQIGNNG